MQGKSPEIGIERRTGEMGMKWFWDNKYEEDMGIQEHSMGDNMKYRDCNGESRFYNRKYRKRVYLALTTILILVCISTMVFYGTRLRWNQRTDEVDVSETIDFSYGVNVFDKNNYTDKMCIRNGELINYNVTCVTDYIPITRDSVISAYYYIDKKYIDRINILGYALYDEQKNLLQSNKEVYNNLKTLGVIVPESTAYIRIAISREGIMYSNRDCLLLFDSNMYSEVPVFEEYSKPNPIIGSEPIKSDFVSEPQKIDLFTTELNGLAQGCVEIGNNNFITGFPNEKRFGVFNSQTKTTSIYNYGEDYGHINDMTYNPNTGNVYIATTISNVVPYFNVETMEYAGSITLSDYSPISSAIQGIAYNRNEDKYYVYFANDTNIYVYNSEFSIVETLYTGETDLLYSQQGIETDGKYIYRLLYSQMSLSYLNVHDVITGKFLKSIPIRDMGAEPQSFIYDWDQNYYISTGDNQHVMELKYWNPIKQD